MLGRFSKGMTVNIPVTFQSNGSPIEMDNVTVKIEHFDQSSRKLEVMLEESHMEKLGPGQYRRVYTVPPHAKPGNYIAHIQYKELGAISEVKDHTEMFQVDEDSVAPENAVKDNVESRQPPSVDDAEKVDDFDINTFKLDNPSRKPGERVVVEDVCVDMFNKPIHGVHVNVFAKDGFIPKSPNNLKVGSAVTNKRGEWKMSLERGEYVFQYKGIALRENREFRKI